MQNARTSAGGVVTSVPRQAITVGPVETWKTEKVSIWQAGDAFRAGLITYIGRNLVGFSFVRWAKAHPTKFKAIPKLVPHQLSLGSRLIGAGLT